MSLSSHTERRICRYGISSYDTSGFPMVHCSETPEPLPISEAPNTRRNRPRTGDQDDREEERDLARSTQGRGASRKDRPGLRDRLPLGRSGEDGGASAGRQRDGFPADPFRRFEQSRVERAEN